MTDGATETGLPALIGRYKPLQLLGKGGMAEVWLAEVTGPANVKRRVALKLVLPEHASNREIVEMFLDEARVNATLTHPNVVQVIDFGEEAGRHFIAMEYAQGRPLGALLASLPPGKRAPDVVVAAVGAQTCAALAYAHARTGDDGLPLCIVHRDVSPDNLYLTDEGFVKVLDFGIARAENRAVKTQNGMVKGKPGYMSPEQCRGGALDGRSDVFALGVISWEMVAMERLYDGPDVVSVLARVVSELPRELSDVAPGCEPELSHAIMAALARDPKDRPSAADLGRLLEAVLAHHGEGSPQQVLSRFLSGDLPAAELGAPAAKKPKTNFEWLSEPAPQETAPDVRPALTPAPFFASPPAPSPRSVPPPEEALELDLPAAPKPPAPTSAARPRAGAPRPRAAPDPALPETPATSRTVPWKPIAAAAVVVAVAGLVLAARLLRRRDAAADAPETASLGRASWRFESEPPGARIEVDGTDTGEVTPAAVSLLAISTHEARLLKDGFAPVSLKLGADAGIPVKAKLVPMSLVHLEATPPGVQVEVDGKPAELHTNGMLDVPVGHHRLRVTKDGFVPARAEVDVGDQPARARVILPKAAYVNVTTTPPGARILVDGEDSGVDAPAKVAIAAGHAHAISARLGATTSPARKLGKLGAGNVARVALDVRDPATRARDVEGARIEARIDALGKERDRIQSELDRLDDEVLSSSATHEVKLRDRLDQIDDDVERLNDQLERVRAGPAELQR